MPNDSSLSPYEEVNELKVNQTIILANGATIKRADGVACVEVNAGGTDTAITGTESIVGSEVSITNGKILQGNASNVGSAKTLGATFSGSALATHQHAAITAGTPAGTNSAPKLNIGTPAFSGTGWATAGQVVTTTDNQTMPAVDTAAGMWLVFDSSPAEPPVLIMSNTIVAGAPAVLTVQGVPAATGAGTYKIYTSAAPAFTGSALATHIHDAITAGTPAGTVTPTYA